MVQNLSQPNQLNVNEVDPFTNIRVAFLEVDSSVENEGGQFQVIRLFRLTLSVLYPFRKDITTGNNGK